MRTIGQTADSVALDELMALALAGCEEVLHDKLGFGVDVRAPGPLVE